MAREYGHFQSSSFKIDDLKRQVESMGTDTLDVRLSFPYSERNRRGGITSSTEDCRVLMSTLDFWKFIGSVRDSFEIGMSISDVRAAAKGTLDQNPDRLQTKEFFYGYKVHGSRGQVTSSGESFNALVQ